jgi:hypothetical protein
LLKLAEKKRKKKKKLSWLLSAQCLTSLPEPLLGCQLFSGFWIGWMIENPPKIQKNSIFNTHSMPKIQ